MQWREVKMSEAIRFIRDRECAPLPQEQQWGLTVQVGLPEEAASRNPGVEWFSDGTGVCCASDWDDWDGPYSEVTPDIDANPPTWWIYC